MNVKDIIGKNVVGLSGRNIGVVVDLVIYPSEWRVYALIVKLRSAAVKELDLEFEKPLFGSLKIEIPINSIASVTDNVILKIPIDELKKIIQEQKKK